MEQNQNPIELAAREDVKKSFVGALMKMHKMDEATALNIYERESLYYKQALTGDDKDKERLRKCTYISLYAAFLEIAVMGISIQPGSKSEAYLEARSTNVAKGTNAPPQWVSTCYLRVSAYGELNLRIKAGQIIRMSNPIVIYEGDHFQPLTNERGDLTIEYRPCIPRKSKKIIGCYVCIVLPCDGRDFKWLLEDDIARLKGYSERGMGGKANALYGSNAGQIDVGFLEAKTIKHAMRSYTKLRIGDNVAFEEDAENETAGQPFDAAQNQTTPPADRQAETEAEDDGVIFDVNDDTPF
jgi:recombinational DNA repair protein RecT